MPSERVARLQSGRSVVLRSPHLPLVRHYHVLACEGNASTADIDEMWTLAHALARELGEKLFGDPQCFSVLYNGERTRRKAWPHFHVILARTPAEKRWALLCLSCKRWLRLVIFRPSDSFDRRVQRRGSTEHPFAARSAERPRTMTRSHHDDVVMIVRRSP